MNIQTTRTQIMSNFGEIEIENLTNVNQPMYLNIEQPNGTFQLVQVTEEQLKNLEMLQSEQSEQIITYETIEKSYEHVIDRPMTKPLGSCENPIEIIKDGETIHSTQNLSQDHLQQIAQALQFKTANLKTDTNASEILYRVVYPEELQLKPTAKRGRPKKRQVVDEEPITKVATELVQQPTKSVRTRSGRITRPPQYIEKDFKKIDTSEVDNTTDLKIVDFEPLKTNEGLSSISSTPTTNSLENHQRKRSIAAQYRCPKCKKAYLGRSKMLQHLEKYPDHGPVPEHCKIKYNDTWNYLIDLCNKSPVGKKGTIFCKELITFFENLRILAKVFFKNPTNVDKNLFFVDEFFSTILGINSGHYILKENELRKDVETIVILKDKLNEETKTPGQDEVGATAETTKVDLKVEKPFLVDSATEEKISDDNKRNKQQNFETIPNLNNVDYNLIPEKTFTPSDVLNNFSDKTVSEKPKELHFQQANMLHSDLLSDNLLLTALPNLRGAVDELILNNVDTGQVAHLLDNSTSSDEVMNVDQFVNERFKNITESEMELPNSSLNLDLQSLDLFQFHTS